MPYLKRFSSLLLLSIACAFSASCIIFPVPLSKRVKNVTGAIMPRDFDIGFIKPGSTHRYEVLHKIDLADTGLHSKRLLLARWKVSHMAVCGAIAGYYSGYANCGRVWRARNMIVEFDGQGIVRKVQQVHDPEIGKVLAAWLTVDSAPPLNLSSPIQLRVDKGRNSAELALARSFLVYHYKAKSTRLSRQQILGVGTRGWKGKFYSIKVEIQYKEGRKLKKLRFRTSPSNLLVLIDYFEQTQPIAKDSRRRIISEGVK